MRTIIYVDGYNLYYGCLKHSDNKWLDLVKLFSLILKDQSPESELLKIKFFTADIKAKVASNGDLAQKSQQDYHRVFENLYPGRVEIIKGYYSLDKAVLPTYKKPIDKNYKSAVWKLEEKQTDVNIALHAYRDASKRLVDQLVFVSNDTDLEPALKAIREDFGLIHKIGVVIPIQKPKKGERSRPSNNSLSHYADWTRRYITARELSTCQLPEKVATKKKPILKPNYW